MRGLLLGATICCAASWCVATTWAADESPDTTRGDAMLARYFARETAALSGAPLDEIDSLEDWQARRGELHRQLCEMLGLDPWPERTPLNTQITGRVEHDDFTVEKLTFQSRPGLYVTGNLYVPKNLSGPAPAVLYVCGHGNVKIDGVSYGSKSNYQHHGGWFARNGYVCLIIDTLQLGELEGIHHGTYRYGMWWWNARGYTPAGVEAWNCVRSLDYLESRPEVDKTRMGVTGRSGGGAYSWWIAALDERVACAVPVAGTTDLENHVVDGVVEGHCDCMFMVNTYRWDYPTVAALVAPRPLLITNTDKDRIFPLEGVVRTHELTRKIYRLYVAGNKLGLQISEGPHKDIQELQVAAFRWFNRWLKDYDAQIDKTTEKFFDPRDLKVFESLPADERNTKIHESFTELAPDAPVPSNDEQWSATSRQWLELLTAKSFRGWPQSPETIQLTQTFTAERDGVRLRGFDLLSQPHVTLRLYLAEPATGPVDRIVLQVVDQAEWTEWVQTAAAGFADPLQDELIALRAEADSARFNRWAARVKSQPVARAYLAPRGIGPTLWNQDERKHTHILRRFMLLGQTADAMRVWDVRQAVRGLTEITTTATVKLPVTLKARGTLAGVALYAALYEPAVTRLELHDLPTSHRDGPNFLNVLRVLDLPQAVALAAERCQVTLHQAADPAWEYPAAVAEALGWEKRFQVVTP